MTKKPKEFKPQFSMGSSFGTSGEWKGAWEKIAGENRKKIAHYMQDSKVSPSPWLDKSLFNSEGVASTFKHSMKKFSEQADSSDTEVRHFLDVPAYLHSTLDRFQKKPVTTPLEPTPYALPAQTPVWEENPFFFLLQQSYLLNVQFLKEAGSRMVRLNPSISRKLTFYTHHLIEVLSLSNQPLIDLALSLVDQLPSQDLKRQNSTQKKKKKGGSLKSKMTFRLGENIGATPGKIVFQNDLFQLIQYEPLTKQVCRQPLLIVPPWTHKYYIFDLDTESSFIRWALESGLTIFVVSWVNPDDKHRQLTIDDYVLGGLKEAVNQVCEITDQKKINTLGYCAGGTLLACLLSYLRAKKDTRVSSTTFLATPFDFSKVDELGIYRFDNQRPKSKEKGEEKKYLEEQYMVQALNLLRANDLIWSSDVNHYLLGQEPFPFDMLYWVCDTLHLSTEMNHTYLRKILIENCLKETQGLMIGDVPIDLHEISTPLFIMAAHEDHIAPWRSVYPFTQMTKTSSTKFVLSTSGHVTGVFNHPDYHKYHFWTAESLPKSAEDWFKAAKKHNGTWWKEWRQWLDEHESAMVPARAISPDRILENAPGSYALGVKKKGL
ncbi:MAG: PHA/PHB synthase family protein [Candidatus Paracaedibacter sp.]